MNQNIRTAESTLLPNEIGMVGVFSGHLGEGLVWGVMKPGRKDEKDTPHQQPLQQNLRGQ